MIEATGQPAPRLKGVIMARNIQQVSTTWAEYKATRADSSDYANAAALGVTDESELVMYQEETPFGTVIHLIEWK